MKKSSMEKYFWGLLRISIGLIFLWAFLDKLFGLGFSTANENSWLNGASPTSGFLLHGTRGPFAEIFQAMAGSALIDVLFMGGLLLIGVALVFGTGVRIASVSGIIMLMLMWLAALWPEHHPFLDDHVIYSIALIGIIIYNAGIHLGLGKWWQSLGIVRRNKWLI